MGRFSRQYSSNAKFREASVSPPLSMKSMVGQGIRHEGTGAGLPYRQGLAVIRVHTGREVYGCLWPTRDLAGSDPRPAFADRATILAGVAAFAAMFQSAPGT